jgi:hypothetical protein
MAKNFGLENMVFPELGGGVEEFRSFYLPMMLL